MRKPSLAVIFLTVMVDLIGFGIVLPLLPVLSNNYGASGLMIGLIMASFSAMQFVFSPIWGKLSDRIGRRPVLLASTAVACLSYVVFAFGCGLEGRAALWVFLASRLIAGICGANVTVAQAYVADITPPSERSKRMGLIGMAFGLGFIIGPAVGGVSLKYFGASGPGWVAAAFCAVNFLSALVFLNESWTPQAEHVRDRPRWAQWKHTMSHPSIALLVTVFFMATFCFACFETTLGLVVSANFHLDPHRPHDAQVIGYLFTYCGLLGAIVQGGLIGRLVKAWGEPKVIGLSLLLVAVSLFFIPYVSGWPALLVTIGLLAIGSSLTRPPLFGMLSVLAPVGEQGATMGVAQSAGSLARIAGPLFAGGIFQYHPALPYFVCAGLALLAGVVTWRYLTHHSPAPHNN